MKKGLFLVLMALIFSCKEKSKNFKASFTTVTADTLLKDKISIRALTIDGNKVWYAGSEGKYGWVSLNGGKNFNGIISKDSLFPEFRSVAQTDTDIFILNAGSPAMLYKISKDGKRTNQVYGESGEKVFYDSMQFFNATDGIAMGDPTDGCLSVIITSDGGNTWTKISCDNLPETAEGEAAFAASNTNLIVKSNKAWMVSGGKKSRVFYSEDKGKNWKVYDTPIIQGSEMGGIFSADFYDEQIGFAVGGDYEDPDKNSGNKILTINGGKTWKLVGEGKGFGYASCIQFIPNSNGIELISAGPSGIYYSYDMGITWKKIYDSKEFHTIKFTDDKTIIAAGQGLIVRLQLK